MVTALFTGGDDCGLSYRNVRDAKDGPLRSARFRMEYLWRFFEPYADKDFKSELRTEFDARYWEMYLTVSLILAGYEVTCPKPAGPDVGIRYKGKRIWFEATSPNRGTPGRSDYVEDTGDGSVPEDKIILRYLNSISTKYKEQYANWLKKGVVSADDAFVIAINPWAIPFDQFDGSPPRILQAAYTAGPPYTVEVDPKTMKMVRASYPLREAIKKGKNERGEDIEVTTGVFQSKEYAGLSGLLCCRVDAANSYGELGGNFQLAPNPYAAAPLPADFRLIGTYYDVKKGGNGHQITPTQWPRCILGRQTIEP